MYSPSVYVLSIALLIIQLGALYFVASSSIPSSYPTRNPSVIPSRKPTPTPSRVPSIVPTSIPSRKPSVIPTSKPSGVPSDIPTSKPSNIPSEIPTLIPSTTIPSDVPTSIPSSIPSSIPTSKPTRIPSSVPTSKPSIVPSSIPTLVPSSANPSSIPTSIPTRRPSSMPTSIPSRIPSSVPTLKPSRVPSAVPTSTPSTVRPSVIPTLMPSRRPSSVLTSIPSTGRPSLVPTSIPSTVTPSDIPTSIPSITPSDIPTSIPSSTPSDIPTSIPSSTAIPSDIPTPIPSKIPSVVPTSIPSTVTPSVIPSSIPTSTVPSDIPTLIPSTTIPSDIPTLIPSTGIPSDIPTSIPSTATPSETPTLIPSAKPSEIPTLKPSKTPSFIPTSKPSTSPSTKPSTIPTAIPSFKPTSRPTVKPSVIPTLAIKPSAIPTSIPSQTSTPSLQPTGWPSMPVTTSDAVLLSAAFNAGDGYIELTFDVVVMSKTFQLDRLQLQSNSVNAGDGSVNTFNFLDPPSNDVIEQGNTTTIVAYFSADDIARLAIDPIIGKAISNTYIMIASATVLSVDMYSNVVIPMSNAFPVTTFFTDRIPPIVIWFTLNMDTAVFTIAFSEPLDPDRFQLSGFTVQSVGNAGDSGVSVRLLNTGYEVIGVSDYNRVFNISLGNDNMNIIKAAGGLSISISTTYLSTWSSCFYDIAGNDNNVDVFNIAFGMQASAYVADVTPPTLDSFVFDMQGVIYLYFSETVSIRYFNLSNVVFTNLPSNSSGSSLYVTLESPMAMTSVDSPVVVVTLSNSQFDVLKLRGIAQSMYVILLPSLVVDTSTDQNVYEGLDATYSYPLAPDRVIPDTVPPEVSSFSVNLTSLIIMIQLTEVVSIQSIDLSAAVIQSAAATSPTVESLVLESSRFTLLNTADSDTLYIRIGDVAFRKIVLSKLLAVSADAMYLAVSALFIEDYSGNPVVPISSASAQGVSTFTLSYKSPELVQWTIDMDASVVTMTFSLAINASTFVLTLINLCNNNDEEALLFECISFDSVSIIRPTTDVTLVAVALSNGLRNGIKERAPLCLSTSTCYMSFSNEMGMRKAIYSQDNTLIQLPISAAVYIPPTSIVVDSIGPSLLVFTLSWTSMQVTLTFNEPVNVYSFRSSGLSFTNDKLGDALLTLSEYNYGNALTPSTLTVTLTTTDYNRMKSLRICEVRSECYLYLGTTTVNDTAGNSFAGLSANRAQIVTPDTVQPAILAIDVSIDAMTLMIYYNDVVNVTSLSIDRYYLRNAQGVALPLTGSLILTNTSTSQVINVDISPITPKLMSKSICVKQVDCLIYVNAGATVDIPNSNQMGSIPLDRAIMSGNAVTSFRLDLSVGLLVLELAYATDASSPITLKPTAITITSADGGMYTLTGYKSYSVKDNVYMFVYLTDSDVRSLLQSVTTTSKDIVKMLVLPTFIVDSDKHTLSKESTLSCSLLIPDMISPVLLYFHVDLGTGILDLFFSEPVVVSSLQLKYLTLVNANDSISFDHSVVITTEAYATVVSINMNNMEVYPNQKDTIHMLPVSFKSAQTIFLTVLYGAVADIAMPGNVIQQVDLGNAIACASYKADATPPTLQYYVMDMNYRQITLYYDEAVNAVINRPTYYTLGQSTSEISSVKHQLATSYTDLAASVGNKLVIRINSSDFDAIRLVSPDLCYTGIDDCYLSFKASAVRDISVKSNAVYNLFYRYGMSNAAFVSDSIPPSITSYTVVEDTGTIVFEFDEVVDCHATDAGMITLQYQQFAGEIGEYYTLTSAVTSLVCAKQYQKSVTIVMSNDAIYNIKAMAYLFKSLEYTYVRLEIGAFSDAVLNPSVGIIDGEAVQADAIDADTISPILLAFSMSSVSVLTLYFSEPVDSSSLSVTSIYIQNGYPYPTSSYRLQSSSLFGSSADRMAISINILVDAIIMKVGTTLLATADSTYLRVAAGAIADTAGNMLAAIDAANAIKVGPTIIKWSLDMQLGMLTVVFSSDVVAVAMTGCSLQRSAYDDSVSMTLTTVDVMINATLDNSKEFYVYLNDDDINTIKFTGIMDSPHLVVPSALTRSIDGSTFVQYLYTVELRATSALPVYDVIADSTAPDCTGFYIDISVGSLTLILTEPVVVIDLSKLVVLSSFGAAIILNGIDSTAITQSVATEVVISLGAAELNSIKEAVLEAPIESLLIYSGFATDYYGNAFTVHEVLDPILITSFTADAVPPTLTYVEVDLSTGLITLTFDEKVPLSTIDLSDITVLSTANVSDTIRYTFTEYSSLYTDGYGQIVIIDTLYALTDYNGLVAMTGLAMDLQSTFVAYRNTVDVFGNVYSSSSSSSSYRIRQADVYIADTSRPLLLAFDFIVYTANLILLNFYFSEPVVYTSFTCTGIVLSAVGTAEADSIALTALDCTLLQIANGSTMSVHVPSSLFSGTDIDNGQSTAYASIASTSVIQDSSGNIVVPIEYTEAVQQGPRIKHFTIDMQNEYIRLVFTHVMNLQSSIDITMLSLYTRSSAKTYTFTVGTTVTSDILGNGNDDATVKVLMCDVDVNQLKVLNIDASTYLVVGSSFMIDQYIQSVVPIARSAMFTPESFLPDSSRPIPLHFSIDLSYDLLTVVFNEPMLASSFIVSNIRIQAYPSSLTHSYLLTGGKVSTSNYVNVTVELSTTDAASIKLDAVLAKDITTTYISYVYNTGADYGGNYLQSVKSTAALQAYEYVADVSSLSLESFALNMNTGVLGLTFSEPALSSSIDITSITLQNRYASKDGTSMVLTSGILLANDSSVIQIQLSSSEVYQIKNHSELARNQYSTFLVISSLLATDIASNSIVPIIDGNALPVKEYVRDSVYPTVLHAVVNADDRYIDFYMSELVTLASIDVTGITFVAAPGGGNSYTLTKASSMISSTYQYYFADVVRVLIGSHDMNMMKAAYPLIHSGASTYVSVASTFIQDTFDNNVDATQSMTPSTFIPDTHTPVLLSYQLNMNTGIVLLVFDESIKYTSIASSESVIQTNLTRRTGNYTSLAGMTVALIDDAATMVEITLSSDMMNYMKYNRIGYSAVSSLLTYTAIFASDMRDLYTLPNYDVSGGGNPLVPSTWIDDQTAPVLLRWFLVRNLQYFHLYFDEPIDMGNATAIQFAFSPSSNASIVDALVYAKNGFDELVYSEYNTKLMFKVIDFCVSYDTHISGSTSCTETFSSLIVKHDGYLSLSVVSADAFSDLSSRANGVALSALLPELGPDCNDCPSNTYTSSYCTSDTDRVCSPCSICDDGFYQASACSSASDVACTLCSPCPLNTYISTECTVYSDTVCDICSVCGSLQYESVECIMGLDTVCNSCEVCGLSGALLERCNMGSYGSWSQENCCFTDAGVHVTCSEVDLQNIRNSDISGRHY